MNRLSLCCILLLSFGSAYSQYHTTTAFSISGKIVQENNKQPIPFATIAIKSRKHHWFKG